MIPTTSQIRVDGDLGIVFDGILRSYITFSQGLDTQDDLTRQKMKDVLAMKGKHGMRMQALNDCLRANLPILLTTDNPDKMIRCLNMMSAI